MSIVKTTPTLRVLPAPSGEFATVGSWHAHLAVSNADLRATAAAYMDLAARLYVTGGEVA